MKHLFNDMLTYSPRCCRWRRLGRVAAAEMDATEMAALTVRDFIVAKIDAPIDLHQFRDP